MLAWMSHPRLRSNMLSQYSTCTGETDTSFKYRFTISCCWAGLNRCELGIAAMAHLPLPPPPPPPPPPPHGDQENQLKAEVLFRNMAKDGVPPDAATYAVMLYLYSK